MLVEIDFPKDKSKLSEATQKQNDELGKKYAVKGYPTILLCDAPDAPTPPPVIRKAAREIATHLNELRATKAKRDEAFAAAGKTKGVAKAKALVAALEDMKLGGELVTNFYGDITEQIKAADPKDETGFGKKAAVQEAPDGLPGCLPGTRRQTEHGRGPRTRGQDPQGRWIRARGNPANDDDPRGDFRPARKFDAALKAVDAAKAYAPDSR